MCDSVCELCGETIRNIGFACHQNDEILWAAYVWVGTPVGLCVFSKLYPVDFLVVCKCS